MARNVQTEIQPGNASSLDSDTPVAATPSRHLPPSAGATPPRQHSDAAPQSSATCLYTRKSMPLRGSIRTRRRRLCCFASPQSRSISREVRIANAGRLHGSQTPLLSNSIHGEGVGRCARQKTLLLIPAKMYYSTAACRSRSALRQAREVASRR